MVAGGMFLKVIEGRCPGGYSRKVPTGSRCRDEEQEEERQRVHIEPAGSEPAGTEAGKKGEARPPERAGSRCLPSLPLTTRNRSKQGAKGAHASCTTQCLVAWG